MEVQTHPLQQLRLRVLSEHHSSSTLASDPSEPLKLECHTPQPRATLEACRQLCQLPMPITSRSHPCPTQATTIASTLPQQLTFGVPQRLQCQIPQLCQLLDALGP